MRVIAKTDRVVYIAGIDNHEMKELAVVSAGTVIRTQRGPVIAIFNQYAYVPNGRTIHSCIQMESYGVCVDDKSVKLGYGSQSIKTIEGYVIPLDMRQGLPYINSKPFTDDEWESLPHIIMTSDDVWEPEKFDHVLTKSNEWYDQQQDVQHDSDYDYRLFDQRGEYRLSKSVITDINERITTPSAPKYEKYSRYFLFAPKDIIQKTFRATTQYARSGWITGSITQTHKAPFPALNVSRRNEPVATDTIYGDTPAIDNGSTCAQFYVGVDTKFCSAYGITTDGKFINTLLDVIRSHGAMHTLVTDGAKSEMSKRVQDVLRHLLIKHQQTEPYFKHQNPAERRYKTVKANVNKILNRTGAPAEYWLLCLNYVIYVMNRMAVQSLDWKTPFERLTGVSPDISAIYRYCFYDKVYYARNESRGGKQFPSESDECLGRFVGFASTCMTRTHLHYCHF